MENAHQADADQDAQKLRAKMQTVPQKAQIAPDGDVLLLFGEGLAGGTAIRGPCLRVSAAHLTLSSAVFRRMLAGHGFAETQRLRRDGCLEKELPDDHYDAFRIIMQVVHTRFDAVPKRVNLELFTEIATLADKYEWHEPLRLHAGGWLAAHRARVPKTPGPAVLPWLWIFWVFERTLEFRELTQMLERRCTDASFQGAAEWPLPECVVAEIGRKRQEALSRLKTVFDELCGQHLSMAGVNRPVSAFCYGMCQIQGQLIGLTESRSLAKKSFWSVACAICSMEDTLDYRIFKATKLGERSSGAVPPAIKESLVAVIETCEANLQGIRLESLKKMKKRP